MRTKKQDFTLIVPCFHCNKKIKIKFPYTQETRERPINYLLSDKFDGCNFVICKKCEKKPQPKEICSNCKKLTANTDYLISSKDNFFSFCSKRCFNSFIKSGLIK